MWILLTTGITRDCTDLIIGTGGTALGHSIMPGAGPDITGIHTIIGEYGVTGTTLTIHSIALGRSMIRFSTIHSSMIRSSTALHIFMEDITDMV